MRRAGTSLLLATALALTGCSGDDASAGTAAAATGAYSADVQQNFLRACVENAARTAGDTATDAQLDQTCQCILGAVEQEYSEAEFTAFEQRLLGGTASEQESSRLVDWSTGCAEEASG